ncbi:MAG TPA: protein kinase [Candidatus Eisenbacteria bacterium]|nr:protein kinase [Candidatus Eisenbacteria bacterium]
MSQRIGPYTIERELGRGGMGVVYLARDTRLGRDIAIKVLPEEVARDPERLARFEREARILASLQHPGISGIYGIEDADGRRILTLEYVNGETLGQRLARGPLPVADALDICRQIAAAVEAAHERGVVHRDLKPGNVMITPSGGVKVLDFGLAKAGAAADGSGAHLSQAPTAAHDATQAGMILGTAAYMSPEQARGRAVDRRTDIWSFACVLFECLTGHPAFGGETLSDTIAAILEREPDWSALSARTPERARELLRRCFEKDPMRRLRDIGDARIELELALEDRRRPATASGDASAVGPPPTRSRARGSAIAFAGLALGVVAGLLAPSLVARAPAISVRRATIDLRGGDPVALDGPASAAEWFSAIAIAPAGNQLAYAARRGNASVLVVRPLDSDAGLPLPGTDGARDPFYSPDGAWIGFFSGNLLRKVAATGGSPITLGQVDHVTGAAWVSADRILVLDDDGFDLRWISASGATPERTVHLATQFGTPDVLPGGTWAAGQLSSGQLALLSLEDGSELAITRRGVLPLGSVTQSDLLFGTSPRWIAPGYLVYGAGDGQLMAMPFDGRRRAVRGESVPVITGVRMESGYGSAEFAIAHDGTLVFVPGDNQQYARAALVNAAGRVDTLPLPRGPYTQPRISPDGTRLAMQERNPVGGWQVLLVDLATGDQRAIDVQGNYRAFPASWMPSGRELMIGLWDPVQFLNYGARIQSLDTGQARDLKLTNISYMTVAPDGNSFVYSNWRTKQLYIRSLGPDTATVEIPAKGIAASFSPDGRWLAWGGTSGAVEASPVPPTGAIYQVAESGRMPVWTPRGDALVYRDGEAYYRVPVGTSSGLHAGRPTRLLEGSFISTFSWNHAMSPDGRLLVLLTTPGRQADALRLITGFPALMKRTSSRPRAEPSAAN